MLVDPNGKPIGSDGKMQEMAARAEAHARAVSELIVERKLTKNETGDLLVNLFMWWLSDIPLELMEGALKVLLSTMKQLGEQTFQARLAEAKIAASLAESNRQGNPT